MKKIVCLLLALALFVSIAACGGSGKQQSPAPTSTGGGGGPSTSAPETPTAPEAKEGVQMEKLPHPAGEIIRYITPSPTKYEKADKSTLYIGQTGVPIQNGNPGSGSDSAFYPLVFDRLIEFDYDTGGVAPMVIKDWKLSEDAKTLDITMRDDITFHNGQKATIDDLLYSLWRYSKVELANLTDKNIYGNIDYDKSEKTGDYSARLILKEPSVSMIRGFTSGYLLCKEHLETNGEENGWWDNVVGSGPYKVESIIQGDRYNLVKNDNYWGEYKPVFDKVVIRYYPEASTMYMDYETGALDIAVNPLAVDVNRVINGEVNNTICDIYPMLFLAYLGFNEEKNPILYDINVRKAIILSIDQEIVAKMAFDFMAVPTTSLMHTGMGGKVEWGIQRDVEAAKAALAESGYKPSDIKLVLGTSTNNVNMAVAEAIQAQLLEVGFQVEMITTDPQTNLNNLRNAGPDTYDITQGFVQYINLDQNALIQAMSKATGSTYFATVSDEKAEELAYKQKTALTQEEKEAAAEELQKYLYETWWFAPLFEQKVAIIYRDYITGIRAVAGRSPNVNAVKIVG